MGSLQSYVSEKKKLVHIPFIWSSEGEKIKLTARRRLHAENFQIIKLASSYASPQQMRWSFVMIYFVRWTVNIIRSLSRRTITSLLHRVLFRENLVFRTGHRRSKYVRIGRLNISAAGEKAALSQGIDLDVNRNWSLSATSFPGHLRSPFSCFAWLFLLGHWKQLDKMCRYLL